MKSLREITAAALQTYDKILFLSVGFNGDFTLAEF